MAWSALKFSSNALFQPVTEVAHTWQIGDVMRFDNPNFAIAQADTEANAEVVGMISNIPNADQFYITQTGFVSGITSQVFAAGSLYYLDPAAPGLTTVKPNNVGEVELPCFIAYTTTSGFFFGSVGVLIEPGALFSWTVIAANQTLAVNQGYYIDGVGALNSLLLPVAASVGDTIELWDIGGNGFTVTQGVGQSVIAGTTTSTVGVGGSIQSTALGNKLILNCFAANTGFICDVSMTAGASIIVT